MFGAQMRDHSVRVCLGLVLSFLLVGPLGCGKKSSAGQTDAAVDGDASGLEGDAGADAGEGLCGDGILDPGEECDDGNQHDDDECLPSCTWACGDGVVNAVELCDTGIAAGQQGACPTDCDDSQACTSDTLVGTECQTECVHGNIGACIDDDGCCPSTCDETSDNDCSANCGNGVVEANETCDPPSSCPATCDDMDTCTADSRSGDSSTCNVLCTNTVITACAGGDGCCPSGCDSTTDSDCSVNCGNGVVEAGETCDPPGSCPTTCNDGNSCTTDTMTGNASTCNVACTNTTITTCAGGDSCCPAACDNTTDSDCSASCGNSVVEAGETCDPPSSCPTTCNDSNVCTTDTMTGSSANCNVACSNTAITQCTGGDGCCPSGCNSVNDSDCSPACGNSVVEAGETCDPPSSCPTTCNDGNACTTDAMTGSAAACNVQCTNTPVTACAGGDSCCPSGCDATNDTDCSPICGNSVVEPGETCDPPGSCPVTCNDNDTCTTDTMTGSSATCNVACSYAPIVNCANNDGCCAAGCNATNDNDCSANCGNSVVEAGETCDPPSSCPTSCSDGNVCTTDVLSGSAANCNALCTYTAITSCTGGDGCCPGGCNANNDNDCSPVCGNNVIEPGETCDPVGTCPTSCSDGNACTADVLSGSPSTCDSACSYPPITSCVNSDGCCPSGCNQTNDNDCAPFCGNGVVEAGETCDPPSSCPATCDDGNVCTTNVRTGNSANCNVVCTYPAITSCTGGDGCCPGGCNATNDTDCSPVCGNGVTEPGEGCDDGNTNNGDGCDSNCQLEAVPTVYRLSDLDVRDPHIYVSIFGCRDLTDTTFFGFGVNDLLQTAVQTDDDGDGELDMSFLILMRPLNQSVPGGSNLEIAMGICTPPMAGTTCDLDPSFTPQGSPYLNQNAGTCLDTIPGTVRPYTPAVTTPGPTCFYNTNTITLTLDVGGILIPLQDVQFGATYVGNPAGSLTNGLLRGFISETDADNTIMPSTLPVIGGDPLSSLLRGGSGCCQSGDDRDNNGGVVGWWFYLNWPAVQVNYTGP
ncbi:MAG: hypothetical protein ABI333_19025 [bacterium]